MTRARRTRVGRVPLRRASWAVRRASRQRRVQAVQVIPALIEALTREATHVIGAVAHANQIADTLK